MKSKTLTSKTLTFAVVMIAFACPAFSGEKWAGIENIEGRRGDDWAEESKGLPGFDLIRARLKDNRVTVSQERATFYLSGDVAEAIYHQMACEPNPEGAARCFRGLAKHAPEGGLACVKRSSEESGKAEYLCEMAVDLRTGRLRGYDDTDESEEEDQDEMDRIADKNGTKYPRLPYSEY
jgi:hypothetical protein